MTATADEDDKSYRRYDNLEKLVTEASKVFRRGEHKTDKNCGLTKKCVNYTKTLALVMERKYI